ncbi:ABC transporter ATP-binding protein [Thermodesulfobacteriota bacterium]
MLLQVRGIETYYGELQVLHGVSLQVDKEQKVVILGANGAGKTTLLRSISSLIEPDYGEIIFLGRNIVGMKPDRILRLGIAHVPEGRELFPELTVRETLHMGAFARRNDPSVQQDEEEVLALFPVLKGRMRQKAETLSGGEQQMLAIARALMSSAKLLMIDEPSLGLAPILVEELFATIEKLTERGLAILLVEQNVNLALHIAHVGYVLDKGMVRASGTPDKLMEEDIVRETYLGEGKGQYLKRRAIWRGF